MGARPLQHSRSSLPGWKARERQRRAEKGWRVAQAEARSEASGVSQDAHSLPFQSYTTGVGPRGNQSPPLGHTGDIFQHPQVPAVWQGGEIPVSIVSFVFFL